MGHEKDIRFLTDDQTMDALVELMPERDRVTYLNYRWRFLESAFPGRVLVVYTIRGGVPADIEVVKFGEFAVGVKETPTARLTYRSRTQTITPVPSRLADRDVFISIPQNFKLAWAGKEVKGELEFRAHYAVLVKTKGREAHEAEGHTYCLALKRFMTMYPHLGDEVRF